jgi:5-methylcytosine-specific restriction protein B
MQSRRTLTFTDAIAAYNRESDRSYLALGEVERKELLQRFPQGEWPVMPIENYAQGQSGNQSAFCTWLEFRSDHLGSIRGGSAKKFLIYKRKSGEGWYFDPSYESLEAAWKEVRGAFVRTFELAADGDWTAIDQLNPISAGPALRIKTLHVYFPQEILPVSSRNHLLHFLKLIGEPTAELESAERIALNRTLRNALLSRPQLSGWKTNEIERFLYWWSHPEETKRVVKITPGENAKYWSDCLENGYIRVGWDQVGNLREFGGKEDFEVEFRNKFSRTYNNKELKRTANELWRLAELEEGDIVVASRGISHILAVGEVVSPTYEWNPELSEYRHTVRVKWDTSLEQDIDPQKRWGQVTIADVPPELYEAIRKRSDRREPEGDIQPAGFIDPLHAKMADALERKGQLILYGPPGTGKTYVARQFSVRWMLMSNGDHANGILARPDSFEAEERRLSTTVSARRVWWVVANPKEWKWDTLFSKGSEVWRRGRIQKHYSVIRPGDLVVGYQATPDKRIMAIAKVSKTASQMPTDAAGFEIVPVQKIINGPTYEELLERPTLRNSEPLRFNNQGCLFALTTEEVEDLADMIGEKDTEAAKVLTEESIGALTWTTFHPSYAYEDFVEGLRPVDAGNGRVGLKLEDGLFKRLCRTAESRPNQRFLLIIDEINRANVSKVFGELLTVLERDKRGLQVVLPQSKQSLVVPPNLYILATMNTADRSIRLLDAALRRRFAFLELMPDAQKLQGAAIGGLALDDLMETLNARISKHVGREKQLGHAYFLDSSQPVTDPDQFAQIFRQEILPVLQEYCYEDYTALTHYLGSRLVNAEEQAFNDALLNDPAELISALIELVAEDQRT